MTVGSLIGLMTFVLACGSPEAEAPKAAANRADAPARTATPAKTAANPQKRTPQNADPRGLALRAKLAETDDGGVSTLLMKLDGAKHEVGSAPGPCEIADGEGPVRKTVSCLEAGAATEFEVRDVDGVIEVWERTSEEGDENSVSDWEKVWTQPAK